MSADRLPKRLRAREAVARAADPCLMPVGADELCWLPGDHDGACGLPVDRANVRRCWCGRPVPASSACGCCCAECYHPPKPTDRSAS